MQFVVGLHSVPYLFKYIFLSTHSKSIPRWMLFFFALIWVTAKMLCGLGEEHMMRRAHLYRAAAVLPCCIVPEWLSTGVFHSVENLQACDLVETTAILMRGKKKYPT